MSIEARLTTLEDYEELRRLKAAYCRSVDQLDQERWLSLFTHDATVGGGFPHQGTHTGREELTDRMQDLREENRAYMSHTAFNPIFDIDVDSGTGRWYFDVLVVFDDDTASWARGTYDEGYRNVDGDWKFSSIEIDVEGHMRYDDGGTIEKRRRE